MSTSEDVPDDTGESQRHQPTLAELQTARDLLEESQISIQYAAQIDAAKWGQDIHDLENADQRKLTTYFICQVIYYRDSKWFDDDLFYQFQQDFDGWTPEHLDTIGRIQREMKLVLRSHGVYVRISGVRNTTALMEVLNATTPPEWPETELRKMTFAKGSRAVEFWRGIPATPMPLASVSLLQQQQPTVPAVQQVTPLTKATHTQASIQISIQPTATLPPDVHQQQQQYQPVPIKMVYDDYWKLPPDDISNVRLDADMIAKFTKTFDKTKRYSGEPYDLLDDKVKVMLQICWSMEIQPNQVHAVFPRILTERAETYYVHHIGPHTTFAKAYRMIDHHFNTEVNHSHYFTDWTSLTFQKIQQGIPGGDLHQALQQLLDKLQLCQRALGSEYAGEGQLRTAVINACRGVFELEMALFKPFTNCEQLFSDLRSSVKTHLNRQSKPQFMSQGNFNNSYSDDNDIFEAPPETAGIFYFDRKYFGSRPQTQNKQKKHQSQQRYGPVRQPYSGQSNQHTESWKRRCIICNKIGCWSTNHPKQSILQAKTQYATMCHFAGHEASDEGFAQYVVDYEGESPAQFTTGYDDTNDKETMQYMTHDVKAQEIGTALAERALYHFMTNTDLYAEPEDPTPQDQFVLSNRYSASMFQGIMPDTGAAKLSTAGISQVQALRRRDPTIRIDYSNAGSESVKFGQGNARLQHPAAISDLPTFDSSKFPFDADTRS